MTVVISEALARELHVRSNEVTVHQLERILNSSRTTDEQKLAALSIYEKMPLA